MVSLLGIIILVVIGLAKWLIYTGLLWGMLRVQGLNYNWPGLLGSSFAATALGYIPIVGPYVGWAVLVLCLWKMTHADIAPDVLFTVTIAGALMFCVNLFAIGWLMGNLNVVAPGMAAMRHSPLDEQVDDDDDVADEMPSWSPAPGKPWQTNQLRSAVASSRVANSKPGTQSVTKVIAPVTAKTSVVAVAAAPAATHATPTEPATAAASTPEVQYASASSLPISLKLKGISMNSAQRSALIATGPQIHDMRVGETIMVPIGEKTMKIVCQSIGPSEVVLTADDSRRVRLGFD